MVLPDTFIAQDKPERMYELAGLSADGIVATVLGALGLRHPSAVMSREMGLH
jgi:1-deoxy-D-xylulose-5-phosphate synthase